MNQISSIEGGIADKTEYRIERSHQVGKRIERRYQYVTDFTPSQTSQIKLQDILFNHIVEMKSEQVKEKNIKKV